MAAEFFEAEDRTADFLTSPGLQCAVMLEMIKIADKNIGLDRELFSYFWHFYNSDFSSGVSLHPDSGDSNYESPTNSDEYNLNMVLKSTTYSGGVTPGAPNKPSKPSGPTTISPGQQYTYSTSTTDNEGDQIYYLFSWGDNSDSGWIGPYNSGDTAEASHSWSSTGTYSVKVKAKDTGDLESKWSDPLSVSTSKFKIFHNFKMLQLLRYRFTFVFNNFL